MSARRREVPEAVKKMADLLRAGATMLRESCPTCNTPLFKLKSGEVVCPVHGRVFVVKSEEELSRVTVTGTLERLERVITTELSKEMEFFAKESSSSNEHREERIRYIILLLEALERTERIRKELSVHEATEK